MVFGPVDLLLHVLVKWVDDAGCNISQGVVLLLSAGIWNSIVFLNVDVLFGVDLQTRHLQHLFVIMNAETGKGEQLLLLEEALEALGPSRGETY